MSRSADTVHREMLSLLPPGWVWPRDEGSLFAALLKPAATLLAEVEATAEAMLDEVDPRTAVLCLPDFERVLGPDPCGRDPSTLRIAARQELAHQRWTARGGQSIAYFVGMAAKRGVTITIEEAHTSQADEMEAGDEIVNSPEEFVWRVLLTLTSPVEFEADSEAGELLYDFELSDIECDIRRAAPAHTDVVFAYLET
ncbi:DUF2313 domain-containing protein [Kaistia dalseonensis]|uniref:Uncharacterized protein YmfQ (DUF2313 family) n=1 Tax=Kaistia dalseonensis TaxID=410840 RepID=A0ABU0HCD1_9HYPH|nr:putative phage tail protein [Kaistia dalseonensis]MCX5497335.1 DUF2313 domain-containing protein [Kaistia dalseonensis]MDQ0439972.1 uncharacterized protein YmfQ (DUF2313 family) [Kaistia dalseonensis]